jgi:hypothetical protein
MAASVTPSAVPRIIVAASTSQAAIKLFFSFARLSLCSTSLTMLFATTIAQAYNVAADNRTSPYLNVFSCVPDEICSETMQWVLTITFIVYIVYPMYIMITSVKIISGSIACVLFYGQFSSFAGMPSQLLDASPASFAA